MTIDGNIEKKEVLLTDICSKILDSVLPCSTTLHLELGKIIEYTKALKCEKAPSAVGYPGQGSSKIWGDVKNNNLTFWINK